MELGTKEDFTYLEISRPITVGGTFLDKVRHYGNDIFGSDYPGMITEAGQFEDAEDSSIASEEEFGPPILTIQGVASARLKVYDEKDLQITLLHRRVPPDMRLSLIHI